MTQEWVTHKTEHWVPLLTLQDVAAAQARGDEIEVYPETYEEWMRWHAGSWNSESRYRSRPRKKTKTIVLREALRANGSGFYWTEWCSDGHTPSGLIKWLDTPAREIEVEE